ncbi:MAG: S1 family peptidase [Nannocystales bacterium]
MSVWFVGALTALALAPGSLSAPTPPPSRVVGGEPVTSEEIDEFSGVVAVLFGSTICTGTLIEDDLILTASHCLRGVGNANQIRVFNGLSLEGAGATATAFGMHPDFDVAAKRDAFDYGFIEIAPGALDATPIPVVLDQDEWDEIAAGLGDADAVTLVGYGLDPDASANENLGIKRKVSTHVRGFTETGIEFVAGGDGRDSCEGDSGGPALARNAAGEFRLIGITARGSDPCGEGGFYGVPYFALAYVSEAVGRPLCGESCSACDCLDTAPATDDGCGCTTDGGGTGVPWLLLTLAIGLRARRRSTR